MSKGEYAGFQDIETDARGNTYIVGTFPGTILKVDKNGTAVTPWYLPNPLNHTKAGYAGLVMAKDTLITNGADGQFYGFDTTAAKGTPTMIARTPNTTMAGSDAIYLPPMYDGKVLIAAQGDSGVSVLRSKDGSWKTAELLGSVPFNQTMAPGGNVPAVVQVGSNSLFMVIEFFADAVVPGMTAGNRSHFPMIDITREVAMLLEQ